MSKINYVVFAETLFQARVISHFARKIFKMQHMQYAGEKTYYRFSFRKMPENYVSHNFKKWGNSNTFPTYENPGFHIDKFYSFKGWVKEEVQNYFNKRIKILEDENSTRVTDFTTEIL